MRTFHTQVKKKIHWDSVLYNVCLKQLDLLVLYCLVNNVLILCHVNYIYLTFCNERVWCIYFLFYICCKMQEKAAFLHYTFYSSVFQNITAFLSAGSMMEKMA